MSPFLVQRGGRRQTADGRRDPTTALSRLSLSYRPSISLETLRELYLTYKKIDVHDILS